MQKLMTINHYYIFPPIFPFLLAEEPLISIRTSRDIGQWKAFKHFHLSLSHKPFALNWQLPLFQLLLVSPTTSD